jgi:hypothetical protein
LLGCGVADRLPVGGADDGEGVGGVMEIPDPAGVSAEGGTGVPNASESARPRSAPAAGDFLDVQTSSKYAVVRKDNARQRSQDRSSDGS